MALIVTESHITSMRQHAQAGYPEEVCGLLLGHKGKGENPDRQVEIIWPASNLNRVRAQDRYELDPDTYLKASREARRTGLEIIGVYHSHPDHPCLPSETDRQRAVDVWGSGTSWSYVILEVILGTMTSWKSWILLAECFSEEPVVMGNSSSPRAVEPATDGSSGTQYLKDISAVI